MEKFVLHAFQNHLILLFESDISNKSKLPILDYIRDTLKSNHYADAVDYVMKLRN